jgi:signal peptidase I
VLILIAFVLALLIKSLVAQAFYIPSGSMEQTLGIGDRVLVNKIVYRFRDIHRGDIVVFNGVDSWTPEQDVPPASGLVGRALRRVGDAVGTGTPNEKDFIKRVIGLPGDRVACCSDGRVTVQPKGSTTAVPLDEPYVYENDDPASRTFCAAGRGQEACPAGAPAVLVPAGRLWVMGDHRGFSSDSRAHLNDRYNGTIPIAKVAGRAFTVVWPISHMTLLSAPGS